MKPQRRQKAAGRRLPSQMARGSMAQAMYQLAAIMLLRNTLVKVRFETPEVGCQIGANTAALDQCCCSLARLRTTSAAAKKTLAEKPPALRKGFSGSRPQLLMSKWAKWTADEDGKLRGAVDEFGAGRGAPENTCMGSKVKDAWARHSERVGRTAEACARRWWNFLVPGLVTGASTAAEDAAMIILYTRIGPMWAAHARVLHRGPNILAKRWSYDIKTAAESLELTLEPGQAVSAKTVARVLRALPHGAASYDAAAVVDAVVSVGRASMPEIAWATTAAALAGEARATEQPLDTPVPADALRYIKEVHTQFADQPDIFGEFRQLIIDFKDRQIEKSEVLQRISYLFAGHWELLRGFDVFIQADSSSTLPRLTPTEPSTLAVPNARELAEAVGNELAALPPAAAAPKKPAAPKRTTGRRCGVCEGCTADECGTCKYCLDKAKRGGSGTLRRPCVNRVCAQSAAAMSRALAAAKSRALASAKSRALARKRALALAVPNIVGLLPTSKIAVTCVSIKKLVEKARKETERKYRTSSYPSSHAPMRLARAGISGRSLHALSTCLRAGGKGLIVASAGSRVSGVGAARVLRVDEMSVDVQRALFDVQYDVYALFRNAESFRVVPRELFGADAELHAGLERLGWQNGGTDQGHHKSRHAELVDVEGAANGHRHGRRACSATMLDGLAFLADGLETKRLIYQESRRWQSTQHAYNHTILTPPGERGAVTHFAHRDCDHCPHTGITRMPLVVLVFVRYYMLDDNGMLRRASPDLARVSGLRFREVPRGAGEDIFAQIADDGFVMFDAHANAHFTHEVMRANNPAEGIYRISIVVHLMSLPEQREGAA